MDDLFDTFLTLPVEARLQAAPAITDLQESARISREGLLALVRDESGKFPKTRLQTTDGFFAEPWVVLVQVINHATEHREQIKSTVRPTSRDQPGGELSLAARRRPIRLSMAQRHRPAL